MRNLLPPEVSLRDLGKVRLKDLSTPERLSGHTSATAARVSGTALAGGHAEQPSASSDELHWARASFVGVAEAVGQDPPPDAHRFGRLRQDATRLQIAADCLESFADGAWMVELAPLSDPNRVPQTVAMVLGLKRRWARQSARHLPRI